MSNTKTCRKCNLDKPLHAFSPSKGCLYGRHPTCKVCRNLEQREKYLKNRENVLAKNKAWKEANPDKVLSANQNWKKQNSGREKQNNLNYIEKNKEHIKKYKRAYFKNRRQHDAAFRLRRNVSCLIKNSYKHAGYTKSSKTHDIVGLPHEDLCSYLESTFVERYGVLPNEWGWDDIHVDHIIPISSAADEKHILELNHFTNLQLLTSKDNMAKGDRCQAI